MSQIIPVAKKLIFLNVGVPTREKLEEHKSKKKTHSLRRWDNSLKHGFISAGQGVAWVNQIKKVQVGDIICAYVSESGFVGIGECTGEAILIKNFRTNEEDLLKDVGLIQETHILELNVDDQNIGEHAIQVKWFKGLTVSKENAKSVMGLKLGITQHIYTDMVSNKRKIDFIEKEFDLKFIFK